MKKLLYTLLLGFVVISCSKDAVESDVAPLILDQEVVQVLDFDAAKATLESLMGVAVPVKGASPVSTRRSAGNSLGLAVWSTSGNDAYEDGMYAHVISEEYTACYDDYSPSFQASYDWDTDNDMLTITMGGTDSTFPINGALRDTYDTDFGSALYFLAKVDVTEAGVYYVSGAQPDQVSAPN